MRVSRVINPAQIGAVCSSEVPEPLRRPACFAGRSDRKDSDTLDRSHKTYSRRMKVPWLLDTVMLYYCCFARILVFF